MFKEPFSMLKKEKVFVIHESGKQQYTGIDKYGTPVILTKGFINFRQEDINNIRSRMIEEIQNGSELDLVLLSGPPILVAIFTQIWFDHFFSMKTLTWNGNGYTFIVVEDTNG